VTRSRPSASRRQRPFVVLAQPDRGGPTSPRSPAGSCSPPGQFRPDSQVAARHRQCCRALDRVRHAEDSRLPIVILGVAAIFIQRVGQHAHWIAGHLRLDFASLNKVEMLPWDVWGTRWEPGGQPTDQQLDCFDTVADLTVDPEPDISALRHRYATDDSLRMDGTVFNVLRGVMETVQA
jgi:hypothetical protein